LEIRFSLFFSLSLLPSLPSSPSSSFLGTKSFQEYVAMEILVETGFADHLEPGHYFL
jgi:hypothetical protein